MADLKFEVKDITQYKALIGALENRFAFNAGESIRNRASGFRFVYLFDHARPNVEFDPDESFFRNDTHYTLTNTKDFIALYGDTGRSHPHRDLMLQYANNVNFRVERSIGDNVWREEHPPRFSPEEKYRPAAVVVEEHPYANAIRALAIDTNTTIMIRIRSTGEEYEYNMGQQDFGYEGNVDMYANDSLRDEVKAVMENSELLAAIKMELGVA